MSRPALRFPLLLGLAFVLGACGGKKAVNEDCAKSSDCADNVCHSGICMSPSPLKNGASCAGAGECASLNCSGGKCAPGTAPRGSGCLRNEECSSNVCSASQCDGASSCSTTSLLPADKKVGDYTKKAAPEVASDPAGLTALIDGGADKYTQNKFACMSRATYASATAGVEVEVWVFDQTDAAGATAAMNAAATGTDLTPTVGDASKEDTSLVDRYLAFARKGKTLARVSANKKTARDDSVNLLKEVIAAAP